MSLIDKICDGAAAIGNTIDASRPDAGDIFEYAADALGAPEWVGDTLSLGANLMAQDYVAAAADVADLAEDAPDAWRAVRDEGTAAAIKSTAGAFPPGYPPPHEPFGHSGAGDYVFQDGHYLRA